MSDEHAVLIERDGRSVLRFRRLLAQTPAAAWEALTRTEALRSWHPTPFRLEPRTGGAVEFLPGTEGGQMPPGRVLAYEPERLLAYTWGEDELRFTIEPRREGCLLTLEHAFADRLKAARDGAGWHLCLRALEAALQGRPVPGVEPGGRLPGGWPELNEEYQRRFGISPGQATPVPEP